MEELNVKLLFVEENMWRPNFELTGFPRPEIFGDVIINMFPVLKGTPYTDNQDLVMEPSWVEHLYKNDINHHYDERCQIFLDMDITDETFKDHALFLLKESLKTFSPYSEKAKELLNKLEALE